MKSFSRFLSEATQSQASMQAKKLGYTGDGHGGWLDRSGKLVARTDKGKLKYIDGRQAKGPEEPSAGRQQASAAAPQPQAAAQAPAPQAPRGAAAAPEDKAAEDGDTLTIVFGRFNPPTVGHEKLLKSAKRISAGGAIKIYPSRTQDPKKNPLDPNTKVSYMRKMFPEFEETIINDPDMRSIFDVLVNADKDGYSSVNIVVGSDRQSEFENLAQKYNDDLYQFDLIRVVSAGVRDADAEGIEGMSASKMRKAVLDNDFKSFRKGTPKSLDDGETQALFDAVRQGMGTKKSKVKKESYSLWEIAPKYDQKTLRENYIKGRVFKIGDIVENLNTGLVGKIMRRGTNHLICLTSEGRMFKSWIKDVMEYTEVKMDRKYRLPGKPNTLLGTTGYLKYAVQQTPGSTLGKENLQKGGRAFLNFINKYKEKKVSTY
jgi:nicotinamide mononucleotide adenylyltransferase